VETVVICPQCDKDKPEEQFSHDRSRRNGRFPWCKSCHYQSNRRPQRGRPTGKTCDECGRILLGSVNRKYCSNSCKDRVTNRAKKDRVG
jgi:hypothetical protein